MLEPTAGNPLYAEEFVRLLADRGLPSDQVGDVPFPESVQALIASRLDLLPVERKTVLQDASVVGKVFWAGAIFEMGVRDESQVEVSLDDLSRRELVLTASPSSMEGEAEYRFKHALVRDVCHAQIPRADRATRHQLAAAWIERKAAGRTEDVADVLAHHYVHALELGRAAGRDRDVEGLEASARRYLALAGEQALALDVASAEASLARALELAPPGHQERPGLLERWAQAAIQQGRLQEARSALEEALDAYRAAGESVPAGRTLTELALVLGRLGDPHREDAITEALALLETQPPGPEHVAAYAQLAGRRELDHAFPEAIAAAERALALAAELGLAEPARALGFLGSSRAALGELQGIDDMRRALDLSIEQGKGREAAVLYNNLSVDTWLHEGPRAALATSREGIDFCKRRGITEFAFAITGVGLTLLTECGLSEQALDEAGPVVEWAEKAGMLPDLIEARSVQVRLLVERGEGQNDRAVAGNLAAMARETDTLPLIAAAFASSAQLLLAQERFAEAKSLLVELDEFRGGRSDALYAALLPQLLRVALGLREPELANRLVENVEAQTPLAGHGLCAGHAHVAEVSGDHQGAVALYAEAAEGWREFGNVPEHAYALFGEGRCLAALGKRGAKEPLDEARDLFASMGYRSARGGIDALLDWAAAAS